jgi:hypothetical protein
MPPDRKEFTGTIDASWLSWYVQRTLLDPLKELEQQLRGEVKPGTPGHRARACEGRGCSH